MFFKRLQFIFTSIVVISLVFLFMSFYSNYKFDNSELSDEIKQKIANKEMQIIRLVKTNYGINFKVPIIITDKMKSKYFGVATFDSKTKNIKIYLNKNRFKESENYMLNDVLPHEYAHALMFKLGHFSNENSGHTLKWQEACRKLNGSRCDRFVNHDDIIMDKTNFFK